ncbi:Rieske (2Fe-2S) protein [Curvivirga sp.]|uniref:Rieske (2Fe-2S) protein n=1 Tax=Curvivirga sp. TaxID=2856848 RepID=UPI003B5AED37
MIDTMTISIEDGYTKLQEKGRLLVKQQGKQIALFLRGEKIYACNNRCPHEGYPLIEGQVDADPNCDKGADNSCVLTCSWHNWKFDLEDGGNLYEGDELRVYPAAVNGNDIVVDITPPDPAIQIEKALENLKSTFARHEYDRMGREIARLDKAGAGMDLAVKHAILWTYENNEYGMTHAYPSAVDWLSQYDRHLAAGRTEYALAAIMEAVGHFAWDTMREEKFPYAKAATSFEVQVLLDAIENEKEDIAIAQVNAAFEAGWDFASLEPYLAQATFAHYRAFGHSAIYLEKTKALIDRFGKDIEREVTLCFVRELVYSWREDEIPEFKQYHPTLMQWQKGEGQGLAQIDDFIGLSNNAAYKKCLDLSLVDPMPVFNALMKAICWNMTRFDTSYGHRHDLPVAHNINWLDFTHGITFANAVRKICGEYPEYWPQGLLQMASFVGRNKSYVDANQDVKKWHVPNPPVFFGEKFEALHDHGLFNYIVSCHLLKTLSALQEEISVQPDAEWAEEGLAALNRFFASEVKGKHVLRNAKQALSLVNAED